MIAPEDLPEGWRLEHSARLTLPGGAQFIIRKDDGSPIRDVDELFGVLERMLGSMKRAEAARARRRELSRQRREDRRDAA